MSGCIYCDDGLVPDEDSPFFDDGPFYVACSRCHLVEPHERTEPVLDPEARVHIDRSQLVRATPLTPRPKPVEHLAPDTIDDADDWHLEPDELAF